METTNVGFNGSIWDYAELSQMAKEAGGPEIFVNQLEARAFSSGRASMIPTVALFTLIGLAAGAAITVGIIKVVQIIQKKHTDNIAEAKDLIIQGIKEYDEQSIHINGNEDGIINEEEEVTDEHEEV